jgi:hypothetical protein
MLRELQALAKQRDTSFAAGAAPVPGGSLNLSISFPIGTRVLDLVTGENGTVVNGKRENVIISPASNAGG